VLRANVQLPTRREGAEWPRLATVGLTWAVEGFFEVRKRQNIVLGSIPGERGASRVTSKAAVRWLPCRGSLAAAALAIPVTERPSICRAQAGQCPSRIWATECPESKPRRCISGKLCCSTSGLPLCKDRCAHFEPRDCSEVRWAADSAGRTLVTMPLGPALAVPLSRGGHDSEPTFETHGKRF
jgi:hypothetical protein